MLLVHSLGGTIVMWEPVMEALAAEREVIAVDMPGFGESPSLPEGVRSSARNLAEAILDFYDTLGIEAQARRGRHLARRLGRDRVRARLGRASGVVGLCTAGFWEKPLGPEAERRPADGEARDALPRAGSRPTPNAAGGPSAARSATPSG